MSVLDLEINGGVARLTLNRAANANTIDMEMAEALRDAARRCSSEQEVRTVTLTGAGRFFCAGGDVSAFASENDLLSYLRALADTLHDAVLALAQMPKPLITVVNGPAAGAGMSLALLGDIVIAGQSAHFTTAYAKIGLTPDGGMSWLLPRLIGLRQAQNLILTNRRVLASEAVALGMVTKVVEDTELAESARSAANALCQAPTEALGA
ncbi:MAG: enoyl-CoA hydratase/isomerase family protein [Azonexus sp.]|nr:enoyl-CoA hydratase/isomerase family protein [Erythrobacter sp.]MDZ4273838.1 enoyl-CoA hydratase/isomerase family protein [Erythrobacter sp.]MDZ4315229.1 enoyl-CoA hydratase/isomerase family protein [Azonexus sp.]